MKTMRMLLLIASVAASVLAWHRGGSVLRWINPRPDEPIKAVDFRSMDAGQAVLLAITVGR